ncbi:hypothetical protein D043_3801B, partial [Vibrio parahaemolyticus EKP-021]
RKS